MQAQEYWNQTGSKKDFEDPLYIEKISPFLQIDACIVEYGCGYGRMLQLLKNQGFTNLIGYDFSESMIERGRKINSELDLRYTKESGKIPLPNESADALILSTVLCCIPNEQKQLQLMVEIFRVLKKQGIIYLSDFLITSHPLYKEKYEKGWQEFGEWGLYTTSENLLVRHHSTKAIMNLLNNFDIQWFEQFDFKTMNQNPVRTFHCVAQKG